MIVWFCSFIFLPFSLTYLLSFFPPRQECLEQCKVYMRMLNLPNNYSANLLHSNLFLSFVWATSGELSTLMHILLGLTRNTVEPLYKGQVGSKSFVLYMEVVLSQRLLLNINVLNLVSLSKWLIMILYLIKHNVYIWLRTTTVECSNMRPEHIAGIQCKQF